MKHLYWTTESCACDDPHCFVCEGGLCLCRYCGGLEGCLTTDCPMVPTDAQTRDRVFRGELDFYEGKWREGRLSCHCPEFYRQRQLAITGDNPNVKKR